MAKFSRLREKVLRKRIVETKRDLREANKIFTLQDHEARKRRYADPNDPSMLQGPAVVLYAIELADIVGGLPTLDQKKKTIRSRQEDLTQAVSKYDEFIQNKSPLGRIASKMRDYLNVVFPHPSDNPFYYN